MNVSFFSILMALLFSTVFILTVHFLRNHKAFLKGFGVPTVLLLYALCIGRTVLLLEFPFTTPVRVQSGYNQFYQIVSQPVVGNWVSPLAIVGGIWLLGAVLCLARFLVNYFRSLFRLRRFESQRYPEAEEMLERIRRETGKPLKIRLFIYPKTKIPMGVGMLRKRILMPPRVWDEEELYYILLHEYTHFLNHDQLVKFLLNVFRCVFWWNPLAYLLETDVADMLEIKCDLTVTKDFLRPKKVSYLNVLLAAVKKAKSGPHFSGVMPTATQLLRQKEDDEITERFDMVMCPPKRRTVAAVQIAFCTFCILLVLGSYSFVFQPYYEPPVEDIYTYGTTLIVEVTPAEWYIVKENDGSFFVKNREGISFSIQRESLEYYLSQGLEIKEE